MLNVKIEVNGIPIVAVHAGRIKGEGVGELCEYIVFIDKGKGEDVLGHISHFYDDGAVVLAKKMLDLYVEKKGVA